MVVISVIVTQSVDQVVAGIPKTVSISTNVPATIFYTLDGTNPTLFSTIYTGPIFLPFNQLLVTLKILATNGTDSSPIVIEQFVTDIVSGNARLPHSSTTAQAGSIIPDAYPFGDPPFQPQQEFLNPGLAGPYNGAVFDPTLPATPTGFDSHGNPTGFTNQPFDVTNYQIIYSDKTAEGEQGKNIGNLPGITTLPYPSNIQIDKGQLSGQGPEQTNQFTNLFDPRAMVIFQDFTQENPNDPPQINRQFFTLENPERARDGAFYFNTGVDSTAPPSGSFLRSHYNPRNNTITYYYRDSWSNKWIISTAPYTPTGTFDGNLAAQAIGRSKYIYEWLPFTRRVLF